MPFLGEISALLTACCWSCSSLFFTTAIFRAGSVQVNITRMVIAMLLLAGIVITCGLPVRLSGSQYIYLIISGFFGLVFGDTFLFKAFQYNGARITMLIMSIVPALSALMAYFILGESVPLFGIAGIALTIAGIVIVVLERRDESTATAILSPTGILFAAFGALGQAAGLVFAKLAFQENSINSFVATLVRIASAVFIILPLGILAKKYDNPFKIYSRDTKAFAFTLLGAIFGPVLGITFSLIAVANAKIGIASTIMATVPILMLPLVKIVYKERIGMTAVTGAVLAVAGVAVLFLL